MKIAIVNGSQKSGESNSGIILDALNKLIKGGHDTINYTLGTKQFSEEVYTKISTGDVMIFAFPLYTDSVPSNMLNMLIELEGFLKTAHEKGAVVYAIINNGFYEGKQTHIAFEIIENWCERSGVQFGGGIGQGAGEMLGATSGTPLNKGPFNNLGRALVSLVEKMEKKEPFGVKYLSPYFPRFLWKLMAHTTFWHHRAYKNNLKKSDMLKRLV